MEGERGGERVEEEEKPKAGTSGTIESGDEERDPLEGREAVFEDTEEGGVE